MGNSIHTAYTWRKGVAIGKPGSNVLGMHSSHYCCGDTASSAYKLNKLKVGDKVIKRWAGGKVVGKVTSISRKVKNIRKLLRTETFTWGGSGCFASIIKCTRPDGQGHYEASMYVRIRFRCGTASA